MSTTSPTSPTTDPGADPVLPPIAVVHSDLPPPGPLDLARSIPIADVVWRHRAQVTGRVRSVRVRTWSDTATLEVVLADATGGVTVAFLGRRRLGGIKPGAALTVEGMVGAHDGKLVIMNPAYDLRDPDEA